MKITGKQLEICENRDWRVEIDSDGDVMLENWSPAGEDLVFYVEKDEEFVDGVKRLAADFDPDDHAEMFVNRRGQNGIPRTIRELIDDADAIDRMLQELAAALAETEEIE